MNQEFEMKKPKIIQPTDAGLVRQNPMQRLKSGVNGFTFLLIFFLLVFTTPSLVELFVPTGSTLDTSWAWMLGYGIQHDMQWGKDAIFTYGPLGFLATPYFYGDHLLWALSALVRLSSWIGFGLFYSALLFFFQWEKKPPSIGMLPIVMAWIIGASFISVSTQSAFIAILLLVYAIQEGMEKSSMIVIIFAGALLAFGALIKSTALIVAVFVLLLYPVLAWYVYGRRKQVLYSLLGIFSFSLFFLAFYLFAGQNLFYLQAYLKGTFAMAHGYTPAMSIHGEGVQTVAALIILGLFLIVGIRAAVQRRRVLAAQLLTFGVMLFWAWKEGFTRHDPGFVGGHAMIFYGMALLVAGIMIPILTNIQEGKSGKSVTGAYLVALIFSLPSATMFSVKSEIYNFTNFYHLITSSSERNALQKNQDEAIRNQFHLSSPVRKLVHGKTVNIIPWDLMMAQGYHMRLISSPVFQAYSAYTPYLDRVNANQIFGGHGAMKIIYTNISIDGRYPIYDEPDTFRSIFSCYKTEYAGKRYSVLKRFPCTKSKLIRFGKSIAPSFGEWVNIPTGTDYMNVGVYTSIFGHLMNILYKPDNVYISFKLADGFIKGPYRFVYPVGDDGLFVKYFVSDQADTNRLFSNDALGLQRIVAFKVTTATHSPDYSGRFKTSFYKAIPSRKFSAQWGIIILPVVTIGNMPLPILPGQKAVIKFALPANQLEISGSITSVGFYQGNYGNSANGQMNIRLCTDGFCATGAKSLSGSRDNSFFYVALTTPIKVHPAGNMTLTIYHQGGNMPDALWVWPSKQGYAQNLIGPAGPLPGKAIRIALKYELQDKP